jgi:hypothetical protein
MMCVPTWRRDATFHASTSGCSAGSPQSPSPPVPVRYPSSVTPICKTTGLATDEREGHEVRIGFVTDQPDAWLTAIANG